MEAVNVTTPPLRVPTTEVVFATATAQPATRRATTMPATDIPQATETRRPTVTPTGTAIATSTVTPVARATSTPLPVATETREVAPTNSATPEATTQATATASPSASPPSPVSEIVIHHFRLVAAEEMNPGKRLTFSWSAEGDSAILAAGTQQRFAPWWQVPLSDTMTIELDRTLFRDPGISLTVSGPEQADGSPRDQIYETIVIPWECEHAYFFSPAPQRCPRDAVMTVPAAQQPFEGGRMVWLQPEGTILVLYDGPAVGSDGRQLRVYEDTWAPGEIESDPDIEPPPDRLQPVRGFGKVWREDPEVREGLGWALAPESAFSATWQFEFNESLGSTSYLTLSDGRIVKLTGYYLRYGAWTHLDS